MKDSHIAAHDDVLLIESGRTARRYWSDLWRYRELFRVLAWRDLTVRYKQTAIGVAWAVLRPFLTMMVFSIVFGRIAKLPAPAGVPYPVLVFAGMLPWQFFASALTESANSLVGNASLISKTYFPRLILPTAAVVVAFVDLLIGFVLLAAVMVFYGFVPSWRVCLLPAFALAAFLASLGPGLWLTALNVKYRDFRYVIPFVVQFGLYVSPVGFSSSVVPGRFRLLYNLNPMVAVIDGFRWCLIGLEPLDPAGFAVAASVTAFMLWLGMRQFRAMERGFADLL